jgi:hypothetical protein
MLQKVTPELEAGRRHVKDMLIRHQLACESLRRNHRVKAYDTENPLPIEHSTIQQLREKRQTREHQDAVVPHTRGDEKT